LAILTSQMPILPNIHFEVSERKVLLRLFDIISVLGALQIVSSIFDFDYFHFTQAYWEWTVVLGIYLLVFGSIFELYELQAASKFQTTLKNVILTTSVTVLIYLLTPFYTPTLPDNRLQIVIFYLAMIAALLAWRWLYINLISSPRFYKRVLVVGDAPDMDRIIGNLERQDPNYRIVGYISTSDKQVNNASNIPSYELNNLTTTVSEHSISEIIVASNYGLGITKDLYSQLINLLESGFPIRDYTQVYEEINQRVPVQYVDRDFFKYFPFSRSNQNTFYLFAIRLLDIIFAILGLLFFMIMSPLIFLGNLIGNRGTFFYSQKRIGKNGKAFSIIKLRTMIQNAEAQGAQYAQKNDSRITSFGSFLRKTRLDELPQFVNVLFGEMSFIGPRPERPVFVRELSDLYPFYETRHIVKPGLTGWAQVMGRYGSSHDYALEKLQYDLYYIKHRNIFLDINIIFKTIGTILYYRGQ